MSIADYQQFHDEVLGALRSAAPADAEVGERIRIDRGSKLDHFGLRTPARRKIVKTGFSFAGGPDAEVLAIWHGVWEITRSADVLFAVLDFYREALKDREIPEFFSTAVQWIDKIDNWAHADDLARVYSWALASNPAEVSPQLVAWNAMEGLWHRRISIVSLVHYSGKNAVFVKPHQVFPLVATCVADSRRSIQKAVGWVLREMSATYPDEVSHFVEHQRSDLSNLALKRATEWLD